MTPHLSPGSVSELVEMVRSTPHLLAVGAGTKPRLSSVNVPKLSTARLSGLVEYDASEFTFTARAGTPSEALTRLLLRPPRRHRLPVAYGSFRNAFGVFVISVSRRRGGLPPLGVKQTAPPSGNILGSWRCVNRSAMPPRRTLENGCGTKNEKRLLLGNYQRNHRRSGKRRSSVGQALGIKQRFSVSAIAHHR